MELSGQHVVDMEISGLALEYFGITFAASVGIIQAAVAYGGFKGISFFPNHLGSYIFAAVAAGAGLTALFTWNLRNSTGIIEGLEQAGLFTAAAIAAYIFTLIVSPIFNERRLRGNATPASGLEALKTLNIFQIICQKTGGKR